jgi:hypothetical protein
MDQETHPYRRVTYEVRVKVARALNVEVADLVEEEPDQK